MCGIEVSAGPLALGLTFDPFLGRCPRLVSRGPVALVLGCPPVGLEDFSLASFGQLLHEEVGHYVVGLKRFGEQGAVPEGVGECVENY